MKKTFAILLLLSSTILWMSNETGAFPENTGAPGDLTCGRAPCHNVPDNVGTATISITVDSIGTRYYADSIHKIKVKITNPTTLKNGFQILALDATNRIVGTWVLTDPTKTQIVAGISFPNRRYVTHQAAGNMQTEWMMSWKAPSASAGNVTFYASVLSANNDGTNQNDKVYTTKKEVTFSTRTATNELADVSFYQIFPNPATDKVSLTLIASQSHQLNIQITDITGRLVFKEKWQVAIGNNDKIIDLIALPDGVFMIQLIGNQNIVSKKIIKKSH